MRLQINLMLALAGIFLLAASCGNTSGERGEQASQKQALEKTEAPTAQPPAQEAIEPEFPLLNNENAEGFLRAFFDDHAERKIKLTTRYGTLTIQLFDDTPLHTANFLMMAKREYFSGTEFTRIVPDFVVQGGNSERETDEIKRLIIGNYLLKEEIRDKYLHQKGALAMARSYKDNPEKKSSAYDFYIVTGRTFNDPQLMAMEREHEMVIPEWKRKVYRSKGGAPHLDGQHTVFGQVIAGWDALDRMNKTPIDERNWPLESLNMEVEAIDD